MRAHMKKHHINKNADSNVFKEIEVPMSVDEFIKDCFGDVPQWAIALRGLRNREGLTQAALGELLGTPQTNISKMEMGKRSIGKGMAKKLSEWLKIDYRLFL